MFVYVMCVILTFGGLAELLNRGGHQDPGAYLTIGFNKQSRFLSLTGFRFQLPRPANEKYRY